MTTLCLHLLLILIEYKPPSIDNFRYLKQGGHQQLIKVFNSFMNKQPPVNNDNNSEDPEQRENQIIEDLTINEHYRLLKVVHGRINLDPLYTGLIQYFQNAINCENTSIPGSLTPVPFTQEVFVLFWRMMTTNQVSLSLSENLTIFSDSTYSKTSHNETTSTKWFW